MSTKDIVITADSPCDLPQSVLEKRDIRLTPLLVTLGEQSYRDALDITPQGIYDYVAETGVLPKTSAVPVGQYLDLFEECTAGGRSVVHISLSSGISSSYQNAVTAAREFQNVYVVDSRTLCHGFGLLVLKAADLRDKGISADKIAERIARMTAKVSATFIVNDLEYLYKGGRCSSVTRLGANLLGIKPMIAVDPATGTLDVVKKYRGKIESVYRTYAADQLKGCDRMDKTRVFISNSGGVSSETIDYVKGLFEGAGGFGEIITAEAGCIISSHCGPKTFAVFFMYK